MERDSDHESPVVALYRKPSILGIIRSAAINLILPFINGVMLGFGEIFAHEIAFKLGWRGARVTPSTRMVGPGVQVKKSRQSIPEPNPSHQREILMDLASIE